MRVLVYGFGGQLIGGIETFILNMNEHMSNACVFDYMIDGDSCIHCDRIAKKGGRVYTITPIRKNPFTYALEMWRTLVECKKTGTRIFYIQLFAMVNVLPMLLGRVLGYTVVLHAHNNGLQSKGALYGFLHSFGKRVTSGGQFVRLTNSILSTKFMFGRRKHAELIYNAIDVQKYAFDAEERMNVREEYQARDKKIVGFIGRMVYQKNPLFMLHIFHEIRQKHPATKLWIVGEGSLRSDMETLIEQLDLMDHVKWFGERNDVENLMQGMDVLLQPSIFEGLGIVLIEAQASGLPCVTSKDVVPDITKITEYIRYLPLDSPISVWVEQTLQLLSQQIDRSTNAQIVAESSFNICREAVRFEKLLHDL